MRLLGQIVLQTAARRHADATRPVAAWIAAITGAHWTSIVDLKADMPSADYVPPFFVFNVKRNTYRLIAAVDFSEGIVIVRAFLTHAEYDKGAWK